MFQSTRPQGARPDRFTLAQLNALCFNPRAHKGRDMRSALTGRRSIEFQSTRPQGARLERMLVEKGLTLSVSIHAPTRGATGNRLRLHLRRRGFNPRAHKGRDLTESRTPTLPRRVSIHAPTRGATALNHDWEQSYWLFQSTRPQGARRSSVRRLG